MRNRRAIISFTFDDFPRSAVIMGARVLEDNAARGTFYLAGSHCGKVVDGIEQYCADDLATLRNAGHEIGCHTFGHARVSALSVLALKREIELNRKFVERYLPGTELRTFSYPFGDVSLAATMQLQWTFMACRSSWPGLNVGSADLGRLRSIRLYDGAVDNDAVSMIVEQAAASSAWLIFYTHDVNQAPSRFGCSPALLEHAVSAALSVGAEILPTEAAIRRITSCS
jgi:peptidoglycan/xylan/chitin deacetylase (PgdA/CDA1 family)